MVSLDGDSFVVPLKVAKMFELVKTMMIDDENSEEEKKILFETSLAKVIEFCRHYIDEPMTEFEKVCPFEIFFSSHHFLSSYVFHSL